MFLKANTEAITAQTQGTAAKHLPSVKPYNDEGRQVEEDGCEGWIEQFEERAKIAGWSTEQRLRELKLLLEKTELKEIFVCFVYYWIGPELLRESD